MPALLLALVVAASSSVTDDPLFVDASRLFLDLEFEQAAFRFEQLGMRTDLENSERAVVMMWLGTSQAKAGDLENAARSFELALALDDTAVAPVAVSPKVVSLIETLRAKVRATKTKSPASGQPPPPASTSDAGPGGQQEPQTPRGGESAADASASKDAGNASFPLALPLAIAAGSVGVAAAAGAIVVGIFSTLDLATAFNPQTTQVAAVDAYGRGIALGVGAGVATVAAVAAAGTAAGFALAIEGE